MRFIAGTSIAIGILLAVCALAEVPFSVIFKEEDGTCWGCKGNYFYCEQACKQQSKDGDSYENCHRGCRDHNCQPIDSSRCR